MVAREAAGQQILLRGLRRRPPRPRLRPPLGDLHRPRRRRAAGRGGRGRRLRRLPRPLAYGGPVGGPEHVGARLSLCLAGCSGRRGAVDRRADLRVAPRRLRAALDALGQRLAALPPGRAGRGRRELVRRPGLGGARERLGHGEDGWTLDQGPITEKSVLPMRSFVSTPMRHGRLFLAGDAAHIVPPTGAKGLNLAIADVALLARALTRMAGRAGLDARRQLLRRRAPPGLAVHALLVWMTSMLHATGDPFDEQLQLSQLRWVTTSEAAASGLAENYAGLPTASRWLRCPAPRGGRRRPARRRLPVHGRRRRRRGCRPRRPGRHRRARRRAADGWCWSTRRASRTSAARRSGRSAACSSSTAPSSAGWASRTPSTWPARTGSAARSSTDPRTTGRGAGPRPTSTSRPARSGPGCMPWGTGSSRSSAGRSGATAAPTGTATRSRASTSPGAPGPASSSRSSGGCARASRQGLVEPRFRHRVDALVATGGAVTGVRGAVLEPTTVDRGRPSSRDGGRRLRDRRAGRHRHLRRHRRRPRPGPQGLAGAARRATAHGWSRACRRTSTAGCCGITEAAGGRIINPDRMWHYVEGLRTGTRSGRTTASASCPARRPSGSTRPAGGCRRPYFPGFDTLGTLKHLARTGHDYSWFVLTQKIIEKEFALSGSEQNPDLTDKDIRQVLSRVRSGAPPARSRRSSSTAPTSSSRTRSRSWSRA